MTKPILQILSLNNISSANDTILMRIRLPEIPIEAYLFPRILECIWCAKVANRTPSDHFLSFKPKSSSINMTAREMMCNEFKILLAFANKMAVKKYVKSSCHTDYQWDLHIRLSRGLTFYRGQNSAFIKTETLSTSYRLVRILKASWNIPCIVKAIKCLGYL